MGEKLFLQVKVGTAVDGANRPEEYGMKSWIFQFIPQEFRGDDFFESRPLGCFWRASQHVKFMKNNDRVFFWRAKGEGEPEKGGIVALGNLKGLPFDSADESLSSKYWIDPRVAEQVETKIEVVFRQIAKIRHRVFYDDVVDVPALRSLSIIKIRRGTNFRITEGEADALQELWDETMAASASVGR